LRNVSKKVIAYHEAGHAAAHWKLTGHPTTRATIEPSIVYLGRVDYKCLINKMHLTIDISKKARLRAEQSIMIKLAGPIAQKRYSAKSIYNYRANVDWLEAVDLALRLNAGEHAAMAYIDWLEYKTTDLVEHEWPIIKRIAGALLRQKTVSSADFKKLLTVAGLLLLVLLIPFRPRIRTEEPMAIAAIYSCSPGCDQALTAAAFYPRGFGAG